MSKKTAFVTGGIGGIGTAICHELSRKGVRIVAGYHPAEEEQAQAWLKSKKAQGADVAIIAGDVASFASCADMAKTAGAIDILVNCAGITRDKTLRKMAEADWLAVINIDLNSIFNVTKQFIDGMTERGYGRIVSISSVNGKKGQFG